jgi:RsmE family RNA methyltransferase
MQIDPCCSWKNCIQQIQTQSDSCGWVLHPAKSLESIDAPCLATMCISDQVGFLACGSSSSMNGPKETSPFGQSLVFAIGPEGGFTGQEILQAVDSGLKVLDLGERILRVETAVSVAAVLGSLKLSESRSDGSTGSA